MERAGWLTRLGAFSVDLAFLNLIALAEMLMRFHSHHAIGLLRAHPEWSSGSILGWNAAFWLGWRAWLVRPALLWIALAYCALELLLGRSPGKLIVGLRIACPDGTRAALPLRATRWALKHATPLLILLALSLENLIGGQNRNALLLLAAIFGMASLVGVLFAMHEARRSLWDWVTGTAVVRGRYVRGFEPLLQFRNPRSAARSTRSAGSPA